MVHLSIRSSSIYSLMLMVFFVFGVSSYASSTKSVDVQTVCKDTPNPSFCVSLLQSAPGFQGADLQTLAQYTIAVLYINVTDTIYLTTKQLSIGHQDRSAKYHFSNCLRGFLSAKTEIEYAKVLLKSTKDYPSICIALEHSSSSGQNCLATPPGYKDKSMLPKYIDDIKQVTQVAIAILKLLGSSA